MTRISSLTPGEEQAFDVGVLLGQRRSFTVIAGRCTAAHAEILRKIRDEKLYRIHAASWEQYCGPHLKITRRHADRIIAQLNEFGPVYFELAALVGVTPEQYRRIEPCVRENALHVGAQVISLLPENSAGIAEAISQLLRTPHAAARPAARNLQDQLTRLDEQGRALAGRFEHLLKSRISVHDRERVLETLRSLRILLSSLEPF